MDQLSLFDGLEVYHPLASRMRPEDLDEFVGQGHLLGEGKLLRQLIEQDKIPSMIFWGPPGVGKTTLAGIIARRTHARFINFSAVTSGIKEIKEVMVQAEDSRRMGLKTVLFVDEIHRFNKAQQDAFLPYVEKGSIILIGATTENPSFEINSALLSRCRVFVLQALSAEDLCELLKMALRSQKGYGYLNIDISDEMIHMIAEFANGDARSALNTLEMAVTNGEIKAGKTSVTMETLKQCIGKKSLLYDKKGEEHYNLISALHKSMRNSDPDAAVYWLARMLEAGEDPLYVARRLVRFASEDIGMADSQALTLAVSVYQACHFLGMPECNVHLSHAVIYLSMAPKSNSAYMAYGQAKQDAQEMLAEPVPLNIRNAPTKLMEELHYGKGYVYAHDTEEKVARMKCLPDSLTGRVYYRPGTEGAERAVKEKLERIKGWKAESSSKGEEEQSKS
ncbi:replication-associated recombination protein A [Cuneatibacter caecimuris]|uniref:Replication-associated recombination protein A n=1 Tax=Cuneatibacter caecimuris TaxID=1796618 RepID=A0A4Q7PJ50_9FIRM|nr:replication-associated recombination protein A [Cuneatibacter caecimuris]RZT00645.1 recombination protein MgsA [Cuneatibacter caecimuris]